jgi:predicted RNase H-related nuclease YkuK (DUF458 family)
LNFISPSLGTLTLKEATEQILAFIEAVPSSSYKLVIGTDSQTIKGTTIFVTALIILRAGKGARFFYHKQKEKAIRDLRSRIYRETELSLQLLDQLKSQNLVTLFSRWPIEVHIDVGQQGETRMIIQEVVGWVTSVGYSAIIKPHSYGASTVADKFTVERKLGDCRASWRAMCRSCPEQATSRSPLGFCYMQALLTVYPKHMASIKTVQVDCF